MDWQTPSALAIVALTALVILWRRFAPRRATFGKATGCGCAGGSGGTPPPGILVHSKRGEPQRIEIRDGLARARAKS